MKSLLAVMTLLLVPPSALATEASPAAERWRFNPRQQTERGLDSLQQGDVEDAMERFDSARRLEQGSPRTTFNAGTAKLLAGSSEAMADLVEAAAIAPAELAAAAYYNLGNAQLAQDDPGAAIESYKSTLRADPFFEDAKFNLELAQRLLDEQQEQQREQQQSREQEQQSEPQESEPQESDQGGEDGPEDPNEEPGQSPQGQPQPQDQDQEQQKESPLPDFEEQQDMTAEQAAAILEAIENLERDQRRKQAEERSRRRAREGKDW